MEYTALVKDKETGNYSLLKMHYKSKAAFVKDIRANGYSVGYSNVHKSSVYVEWSDSRKG